MAYGIPLDKAELLSVLLEGVLYGKSKPRRHLYQRDILIVYHLLRKGSRC